MTVPSSGELSWGKIAQERLGGSYIAYSSASRGANAPVFNIYKGGSTGGGDTAGSSYPTLNSASPGYSPLNTIALSGVNLAASPWYSYDEDATSGYTLKRRVKTSDSTGTVTGDTVDNLMTITGGSPSTLSYSYLTTFGTTPPFTTTTGLATSNKYTSFVSVGFAISSNPDLPSSGFGTFGDWGINSVSKNSPSSPSPALNPGPTAGGGFGNPITPFGYALYTSRGQPGYQCKNVLSPPGSMSYIVSSGDTVFFDYEQSIFVN